MISRASILALALTLTFVRAPVASGADVLSGYATHTAPTGIVRSRGWGDDELAWARDVLPRMTREIEARVGAERPTRFVTVLTDSGAELRRIVRELGGRDPGPTVQGVAFPSRRWIVLRGDLMPGELPEDPSTVTLRHEVAHLVLHARSRGRLPRWFDEGAAEWLSRGALHPRIETHLVVLARTGSLYRFETLAERFPGGHVSTSLAYGQSLLMVRWIEAQAGPGAIARVLDGLAEGRPFDESFEAATGVRLAAFEEGFSDWVAHRRSLAEVLLAIAANPWIFIALLALLAIARGVVKRRRGMRRLELEEAATDFDEPEPIEDLDARGAGAPDAPDAPAPRASGASGPPPRRP